MSHLTDEQFEEILGGTAPADAHLDACPACRRRLADHRAIRGRLREAFASVEAGDGLAERIRAAVRAEAPAPSPRARTVARPAPWRRWPALAAAAMIVLAIGAATLVVTSPEAHAAQRTLAEIHQAAASGEVQFHTTADTTELAEYFRDKLGFTPALPRLGQGMAIRGCCKAHFRGGIVGSYVVDTPKGVISIIVVNDMPASMGMTRRAATGGQEIWAGAFARNQMAAARLNDRSYCAVGEVPWPFLADLLTGLVPHDEQ